MQETDKAATDNLEKLMGQLAQAVGQIQQQLSGRLPSQTEKNPDIRNVSVLIVQEHEIEEEFEDVMDEFLSNLENSEEIGTVGTRRNDSGDRRPQEGMLDDRPQIVDPRLPKERTPKYSPRTTPPAAI